MAKGIGNGYPLAAVVTTPGTRCITVVKLSCCVAIEISQSLNKALHVNTFGGNPVSCAVGSAVLEVRRPLVWFGHQTAFFITGRDWGLV